MINIYHSAGHNEFTFDKNGSKGLENTKEGIKFEEFNFNIGVSNEFNKLITRHKEFKVHQLEFDNNKIDMTLAQRVNYINQTTKSRNDDLAIEFHANFSVNKFAQGQWGFYHSEKGKKLLDIYRRRAKNSSIPYVKSWKCINDNSWLDLYFVMHTKPTAVLFEFGFFSNYDDRMLLRCDKFRKKCANDVYLSVLEYYNVKQIEEVEDWKECLKNSNLDDYKTWIDRVEKMVEIAKLDSNVGDFEVLKYLPDLIVKLHNSKSLE